MKFQFMKSLFTGLFGRISAIFLVLLLLLSLAQLWLSVQSARKFSHEADQSLNRGLARNLAIPFQPALAGGLDEGAVSVLLHDLMLYNPRVEIYLLDSAGRILAHFDDGRSLEADRVPLAPIAAFLSEGGSPPLPLYGLDPRHPSDSKPFSAAPITIGGEPGYLYLILGGEQYQSIVAMMEKSYIIKGSILSLGATFVLISLAGLLVFFLLTKRLRGMSGVVRAFESGDHTRRVHDDSLDEIGQLARAFNEMADRIEATLERLRASDVMRRELIANVSHDLRSPLSSIQGYLETLLMKEDSLPPRERQDFLQIIHGNTLRLAALVEELFELSKLEAGQVEPRFEDFSLDELTQDVVMKFQPQAQEQNIDLAAQGERNLPLVRADIALIERVLANLIDNALRFTPPGGQVRVSLHPGSGAVRVAVGDSGQGIDPEALPHVFERFFRADKSRSRSSGPSAGSAGSGLGLAIVKCILEMHQSDISVESSPGDGTRFLFDLAAPPAVLPGEKSVAEGP